MLFYVLFGAAFTAAVSIGLGRILFTRLDVAFDRDETWVLSFVVGAPLLSLIVFLLGTVQLARKGVFLVLGLAILALAWRHRPRIVPREPVRWRWLYTGIAAAFFVLYLFNAMAPEISPDGSTYHLGLVGRYYREHGFHVISTNMYGLLSQGVEMLFLFAYAFGRHSSAALVHFSFLVALAVSMALYGRRFGFPVAGVCGSLFVFLSPMFGIDGSSAYIDAAVACTGFGLFYLLQIWDAERTAALLVPVGILAGFGYAAKYTAFVAVPYAVGFVAWKSKRRLRSAAAVALWAGVMIAPWVVRNVVWTGNPVAPFFNRYFRNSFMTPGFEAEYTEYLRHYELKRPREIPLEVTVKGNMSGLLGPLFLLAPLGLLALRWKQGRQLLLACGVYLLPYPTNIGTRFLMPAAPFAALAMALVFAQVRYLAPAVLVLHAVLSWPSVIPKYASPGAWRLVKIPLKWSLRIRPEEDYLASNMPGYAIARLVEQVVPRGDAVLTFSPPPDAYTTRNIRVVYQSASNKVLGGILWAALYPDYAPTWQHRFRFAAQPLRRLRVVQTATAPDFWSIAEMRVYQGDRELPRAPEWRIRAFPNPWDVQMAFDNSPVTVWSTCERISPGMYLELDFGRAQTADSVLLEMPHSQWKVRMKLEGQDASGKWKELAPASEEGEGPPMLGLRRAAIEELKTRGIHWMLVTDTDYKADDYAKNPKLWGITLMGRRGATCLYRFD